MIRRTGMLLILASLALESCQVFKLQPGVLGAQTPSVTPGECESLPCTPTPSLTLGPETSPSPSPSHTITPFLVTAVASATPRWGTCQDSMALVLRLDEMGQILENRPLIDPGRPFRYGWRVRNTGSCTWDSSYTLVYAGPGVLGGAPNGSPQALVGRVSPGQMFDFYVDASAPDLAGAYQDAWELRNGRNLPVGEALLVEIEVPQVALATVTPVVDIYFAARPEWLERIGMPAVITWETRTARQVYFYAYGQAWHEHPVQPSGSTLVFPSSTTSYYLRVEKWDESVETRKLVVYLEPFQPPIIVSFVLHPRTKIAFGDCVKLTWNVRGGKSTIITIIRDEDVIAMGLPLVGAMANCPRYTGDIVYTLYAVGPGGEDTAKRTIEVVP